MAKKPRDDARDTGGLRKAAEAAGESVGRHLADRLEMPELPGYGIHPAAEGPGWLAYRVTSRGEVEVLTPVRHGKHMGQKQADAMALAMNEFKREFARAKRP